MATLFHGSKKDGGFLAAKRGGRLKHSCSSNGPFAQRESARKIGKGWATRQRIVETLI